MVTKFVLDTLKKYKAKATFFCIGKNIENYPKLFQRIINEGHSVANHTQNHVNGWKTNNKFYIEQVNNCQLVIEKHLTHTTKKQILFRPPYGKIKKGTSKKNNKRRL